MVSAERAGDQFVETWEALAKNLGGGENHQLNFLGGLSAQVLQRREEGRVLVRFEGTGPDDVVTRLDGIGQVPLPPYIEAARKRSRPAAEPGPSFDDRLRYQTVYATQPGAVAAPTAGLHFTPELLQELPRCGHQVERLTLHVGPGTFRPVKSELAREHRMDEEHFDIPSGTAVAINAARAAGRPIVAIGTTVVRALEAAARADAGGAGAVQAGAGATSLFLLPGDDFRVVTDLVTNFHLPQSTLLMLVSAFAGRESVLAAYQAAVEARYRFYSYGDAMLITGRRAA